MKRVLIVDDEKSFLLSLRDGLGAYRKDFKVLTAENGREAVVLLRTVPVDLLVTDLKLPVMDGFELLAWVSRHQPQLPVVVMSAFGTAETEARLSKMHTVQYLEKPLDLEMLREAIYNGLKNGAKSYIRGITLATFLQLMAAEQKTCTLKVTAGSEVGYLYVRQGELIDADSIELQGESAAMEIVGWENAEIEMDGICRRKQRVIELSMEHILIEAFRRIDERSQQPAAAAPAERETVCPAGAEPGAGASVQRTGGMLDAVPPSLRQALKKHSAVQEFAIFDPKGFLLSKNLGTCSVASFDPLSFIPIIDQVGAQLSLGSFSRFSFRTADRSRYLLFGWQQHQVVAKLLPGSQPREIVKQIHTYVNRAEQRSVVKGS